MLPSHHIWPGESLIRQAVSNGTPTTHSVVVEKSPYRSLTPAGDFECNRLVLKGNLVRVDLLVCKGERSQILGMYRQRC
jgi:hypothetical protein